MTTAIEFPFTIERPRNVLLAPLRDAIERLQEQARAELAELEPLSSGHGSMLEDVVADAIDGGGRLARSASIDCRDESYRAATRTGGYETWPAKDLDELVRILDALSSTLARLAVAWRDLARAEAHAFQNLFS